MNFYLISMELAVVLTGIVVLLVDLWTPPEQKRYLGYAAAAALGLILLFSFFWIDPERLLAFGGLYSMDALAMFFKRFFLAAGILVLILSVEFADRIRSGIAEYYALILFALTGMMFAASANDFILVFVSVELITVVFYVLTSFQRHRTRSLEAGVKYLILGALSSAFMVYGIALVFGTGNTTNFDELFLESRALAEQPVFVAGLLFIFVGLGFKIAAFPFQMWTPDVYEGAPAPTTAFLAVGSKAAGIVLLLRVFFSAAPDAAAQWRTLLMAVAGVTILYGNLCALPQRNLKRLLGYSSIAHAGYLLLGFSAFNHSGSSAILYYLSGYLFTVVAAFAVICLVMRGLEGEDIGAVAGLSSRSPWLAAAMGLAMVSLAGIPPLAGFFGKFLLFKAVLERAASDPTYYALLGVAIVGVVISFYYYLGVVRAMYWSESAGERGEIAISHPVKAALAVCIVGMLYLGLFPNALMNASAEASSALMHLF